MSLKLPRLLKSDTPAQKVASINCDCLLCQRGFIQYHIKPTWNTILRVVFYSLKKMQPLKEYFNLNNDIYLFIENHNHIFSRFKHFEQKPQVWKKAMIDALSHSKSFSTGFPIYGINGYWKLKNEEDPWKSSFPEKVNNQSWNWAKSIPETPCVLEKTIPSSGRNSPESRCVATPVHMLEAKKPIQKFVVNNSYKKPFQSNFDSYQSIRPTKEFSQIKDIKERFDVLNQNMMLAFQEGSQPNENMCNNTCDQVETTFSQPQNMNIANEIRTNENITQPFNYNTKFGEIFTATNEMDEDNYRNDFYENVINERNQEVAIAEQELNQTITKVQVSQEENKEEPFISFENKGFMINPTDICCEESFISHNYY